MVIEVGTLSNVPGLEGCPFSVKESGLLAEQVLFYTKMYLEAARLQEQVMSYIASRLRLGSGMSGENLVDFVSRVRMHAGPDMLERLVGVSTDSLYVIRWARGIVDGHARVFPDGTPQAADRRLLDMWLRAGDALEYVEFILVCKMLLREFLSRDREAAEAARLRVCLTKRRVQRAASAKLPVEPDNADVDAMLVWVDQINELACEVYTVAKLLGVEYLPVPPDPH